MSDFTATRVFSYVGGALIDEDENNTNENTIYTKFNASIHGTTGHKHSGGTGDAPKLDSSGVDLTANYSWTGTHTFTDLEINDTSSDHQYVLAVSELAADRTVTLPLLAGNDEFVFKDHIQVLSNKSHSGTFDVNSGDISVNTGRKVYFSSDSDVGMHEASNLVLEITNDDGATSLMQFATTGCTIKRTGEAKLTLQADTDNSGQEDAILDMTCDAATVQGKLGIQSNAGALVITGGTANSTFLADMTGNDLHLGTSGISRMKIDSSGITSFNKEVLLADINPPTANHATRHSVIKGWAFLRWNGVNWILDSSYNVDSVIDTSDTVTGVAWDTDFANSQYVVSLAVERGSYTAYVSSRTAGNLGITLTSGASSGDEIHIMAIGNQ